MQKTLYIHIGHYKTGTTALQVFASRHQAMLAETHGLDYPSVRIHNAKHSGYAFALYKAAGVETLMHGYSDPTPPEPIWAELDGDAATVGRVEVGHLEGWGRGLYGGADALYFQRSKGSVSRRVVQWVARRGAVSITVGSCRLGELTVEVPCPD